MSINQEGHSGTILLRESDPFKHLLSQPQGGDGMVFAGALPHIVKQQRQIENGARGGFGEQAGECVARLRRRRVVFNRLALQSRQRSNSHQRVFVHGVTMIEVAGQPVNPGEQSRGYGCTETPVACISCRARSA